jgi:hypothetical protein
MDPMEKFFNETYPKLWHEAYDLGENARKTGLPRQCNLNDPEFMTPGGHILKDYKNAWEQGWDLYKIPEIFKQMEDVLNELPTKPYTGN